jgi:hypothetical protein
VGFESALTVVAAKRALTLARGPPFAAMEPVDVVLASDVEEMVRLTSLGLRPGLVRFDEAATLLVPVGEPVALWPGEGEPSPVGPA